MYSKYGLAMYYGANAKLFEFASEMRDKPTQAEEAMWQIIKTSSLSRYKFRRQHPISTFIADFYCHDKKTVVEIDGQYHMDKDQRLFDNFRDEDMAALGITVLRFTNDDILNKHQAVAIKILQHLER